MSMFTCLMPIAFLGIFYALLIRPQQKQQEQHQKMVEDITSGTRVIAERFFDESGGMQLVVHCPLGGAINRAFGLALRKRFCVGFDFELQAAATDDGIVLSLGEQHSFPLPSIFEMVHPDSSEVC